MSATQSVIANRPMFTTGLKRPNWICRLVKQRAILLRDRSGSMRGQKANDAAAASADFIAELADPANKDGFKVAVIDFATSASVVHDVTPATALAGNVKPLSVGLLGCGSTNITAALEEALRVTENSNANSQEAVTELRPVAVLFTDGIANEGGDPCAVGERLKQKADVVTVAFGTDADEDLLRKLASTPQHFYKCTDGRKLRSFLAAVGATMTQTMAARTNATLALTQVQQQ